MTNESSEQRGNGISQLGSTRRIQDVNSGNQLDKGSLSTPQPSPHPSSTSESMRRAARELIHTVADRRSKRSVYDPRGYVPVGTSVSTLAIRDDSNVSGVGDFLAVDEERVSIIELHQANTAVDSPTFRVENMEKIDYGSIQNNSEKIKSTEQNVSPTSRPSMTVVVTQQISAVIVIVLLNLMMAIPFGASYFPVGWKALAEEDGTNDDDDGDGDGDGDGDVDMFGFLEKQKDEEKKEKKNTKIREDSCKKKKRLNIALFYADDWTMKVLGKLNKDVKTPNIDAMADNGILFTNNCVTTSVCWSSRATFATGVYSAIHKHNMPFDDAQFETKVWSETLYPLMRSGAKSDGCKEGYYTGLFGKWHKLEIEEELDAAFDESKIYYGMHWEERDGRLRHVTELNRNDSLEFLDNWERRFNDQEGNKLPFFLTTAFFATHAEDGSFPSYKPENSTRLRVYPDSMEIPIPKTATAKHYQELPYFLKEASEGRTRWKFRFEPMYYQKNIKDMFAMATEVDEAVGAIIDKLKSMGVYDDTVLIFTTDNGNLHGEHGLAEKWYPFEESLRVPLVIVDPRMPKERRGTRSEAWTLNIDLAPTILSIANIPQSEFMQGRDIADLYLNDADDKDSMSNEELRKKVGWREDFFYEFNLGNQNDGKDHPWDHYIDASFALVTDEWKYVYWPAFDYEQLFHRSVDPYDEWDLLNKIFRPKDTHVSKESNWDTNLRQKDGDNSNGCCDTVKSTIVKYLEMKARYAVLKEKAQRGDRV